MRAIRELLWDEENEAHIARHHVTPQEVEEVCFGRYWMIRSGRKRKAVFGQTGAGRYLLVVVERMWEYGEYGVITARDMGQAERRQYQMWRGRR